MKPKSKLSSASHRREEAVAAKIKPKMTSARLVRFAATSALAEEDMSSLLQLCSQSPDHVISGGNWFWKRREPYLNLDQDTSDDEHGDKVKEVKNARGETARFSRNVKKSDILTKSSDFGDQEDPDATDFFYKQELKVPNQR